MWEYASTRLRAWRQRSRCRLSQRSPRAAVGGRQEPGDQRPLLGRFGIQQPGIAERNVRHCHAAAASTTIIAVSLTALFATLFGVVAVRFFLNGFASGFGILSHAAHGVARAHAESEGADE